MGKPQFSDIGRLDPYFYRKMHFNNGRMMIKAITTDSLRVKDNLTVNGDVLSKAVKHTAIVDLALPIAGAGATLEATFSQPANTIITAISIFCETSPVVASGDIGFKVGNATGGAQLVAAATDGILDGGTTIVVGHVRPLTLVAVAAKTATAAVDLHYTSSARNVFLQVSHTTASTTIGAFKFIIEYDQIA